MNQSDLNQTNFSNSIIHARIEAGDSIIVPTRSLANILLEEHSVNQLKRGLQAWLPPPILTWSDLVQELWRVNQSRLIELVDLSILSSSQSLVLWERVLNAVKREEDSLRLLNVAQTAKAAQSARDTCLDWQIDEVVLKEFANLDLDQFLQWQSAYEQECDRLKTTDFAGAVQKLGNCVKPVCSHKNLILYAFDLKTSAQLKVLNRLQATGVAISHLSPKHCEHQADTFKSHSITEYLSDKVELNAVLTAAREYLGHTPSAKISVVIPDLQNRLSDVAESARSVFYPNKTPLAAAQDHPAYRISLGKPLNEWMSISTALLAIEFLKNSISAREFGVMLRSAHFSLGQVHRSAALSLTEWLAKKRIHTIKADELPKLLGDFLIEQKKILELDKEAYQDRDDFCEQLGSLLRIREELLATAVDVKYAKLAPSVWSDNFTRWLEAWRWTTALVGADLSSEQYQLGKRFERAVQELKVLDSVLPSCGLTRAVDLLNKVCTDSVFLPQAEPAPILISGMYEAIGREVDLLFIMGMTEEFPAPFPKTAFIPANALLTSDNPAANHERHYKQMEQVLTSLISGAEECRISYAKRVSLEPDEQRLVSPFFRKSPKHESPQKPAKVLPVELESYQDEQGLAWPDDQSVKHGMSVFKEQSSCAFKAFATHRLKCMHVDEPEFGLEPSVQGTVIHHLLFTVWGELAVSAGLDAWLAKPQQEQNQHLYGLIEIAIEELTPKFNTEQMTLVRRERSRYITLLREWLEFEAKRPVAFSVLDREWQFTATLGGIEYHGSIDRIDATDSGDVIIMDYKTGNVARSDWEGERLINPQMPLYYLGHQQLKKRAADGIAYAVVRRNEMSFAERAESGLLKTANRNSEKSAQIWSELRDQWQPQLEQLAEEFLQGYAAVQPVNDAACSYCPYDGLCRIKQLHGQFSGEGADHDSDWGNGSRIGYSDE